VVFVLHDRAVNNAVSEFASFLTGRRVRIAPAHVHGGVASGISVCCGVAVARFEAGTVVARFARISCCCCIDDNVAVYPARWDFDSLNWQETATRDRFTTLW
jgi:hypothetical protein